MTAAPSSYCLHRDNPQVRFCTRLRRKSVSAPLKWYHRVGRKKKPSSSLTSYTAKPMVSKSSPSFLISRRFFCISAITTLHMSSSSSASCSLSLNCGLVQKVSADSRVSDGCFHLDFGNPFGLESSDRLSQSHRCSSCSLQRWSRGSSCPLTC